MFGLDQATIDQLKAMPAKIDCILAAVADIQNRLTELQVDVTTIEATVEKPKQ